MRFHILGSGSKGNATIITSNHGNIMIDFGLSTKKQYLEKMASIGMSFNDIQALFITHCHVDHVNKWLCLIPYEKRYTTDYTSRYIEENGIDSHGVLKEHIIHPYDVLNIAGFEIEILPTSHDAKESIGFLIKDGDESLSYITDTGFIYDKTLQKIQNCDYYIMESNHDIRMLLETSRPQSLKDRILGDKGHLSNEDCSLYLSDVVGPNTKEIIFAHISEEANTPQKVIETFKKVFKKRGVSYKNINYRCASQKEMLSGGKIDGDSYA